jgi:P-type Ca2+ transporter type 2C
MNRMAVRRLWANGEERDLGDPAASSLPEALHPLLEYAVLASHRRAFDPMESAIGEAGMRHLAGTEHLDSNWELVDDDPLSPQLLAMSRVGQSPDRQDRLVAAKGAPEAIMDLCHLDGARHTPIARQVESNRAVTMNAEASGRLTGRRGWHPR